MSAYAVSANTRKINAGSFRDPSGFIFRNEQGTLLRQVNRVYEGSYRRLMDSGLYESLVSDRALVPHEEVGLEMALNDQAYAVIQPQELSFVSYPYEWCFSALKHAAIMTLKLQRRALKFDMSLKDASAYNIQFEAGRPIFIDTLSFEDYQEGLPWVAYSQFCRQFLAPLAIMAKTDVDLGRLLALDVDGVPLQLASKLLPRRTWLSPGMFLHLHAHGWMIDRHAETGEGDKGAPQKESKLTRARLLTLLDNLQNTVSKLRWKPPKTEWADYYQDNSYSSEGVQQKKRIVADYLEDCGLGDTSTVWDLGANTGEYSRLATAMGVRAVAFDIDPACVEANYLASRKNKDTLMLPLRQDLTNPSPAIGWAHTERDSLADRGPVDVVMALALIHHLAVGNNLPLGMVARYFARLGKRLIIEFVPKGDPQVQRLLRSREDIFPDYTQEGFEAAFGAYFEILKSESAGSDGRVVFLMECLANNSDGSQNA